jgi:hypothetical protein
MRMVTLPFPFAPTPLLCVAILLASAVAAPGYGPHWPATYTTWPRGTPSQTFPDGPVLGNAYIAATVGGHDGSTSSSPSSPPLPGLVNVYLLTNGFWSVGNGTNSTFPPLDAADADAGLGFAGCPAANCTIPVGGVIGGLAVSSTSLAGTWRATSYIENATTFVWLESNTTGGGGLSAEIVVWVSATTRAFYLSVRNTGSSAIQDLNVTLWANANILNVPCAVGCADPATGAPLPSCPASSSPLGLYVRKQANKPGSDEFPIDGVISIRPLLAASAAVGNGQNATLNSTIPLSFVTPQSDWSTGKTVLTQTSGTSQLLSLPPGAALLLVGTAAATRDPSVFPADPADAATQRLTAVEDSVEAYKAVYGAHVSWWTAFWGASSFALDPSMAETEAFTYTQLYAMGSASREGELVADLWIWRTTDYPLWR